MKARNIRVVVTGIGTVTPLGLSMIDMWPRLLANETAVQHWPDLSAEGFRSANACWVGNFDCPPLRRGRYLGLSAARQAIEQAGIKLPEDTGVYIGSTLGESAAFESAAAGSRIRLRNYAVDSFAQAIAQTYTLRGKKVPVATACAAGNYAVGLAMQQIKQGRSKVALAGGIEPFSKLAMAGFSRSRAMSGTQCKPFDLDRNGMLLGEGAAIFVLEEAEHAIKRGKIPLAEILSLGLSCDAYHPTAPLEDGSGMAKAIQNALQSGNTSNENIDWVNTHGSGTRLSDAAEAKALLRVFGPDLPSFSGSKGALGHALGASAAIELAICVQGLLTQTVPPTPGHQSADPDCGISCFQTPQKQQIDYVINCAFAFGGLNSALLIRSWKN